MRAFDRDGRVLILRETRHGGGEGRIYGVDGETGLLAKVFHPERLTVELHRKLIAMIEDPPVDPTFRLRGHHSIAWPQGLIYAEPGGRRFVGYTMPALDVTRFRECHSYFDPGDRLLRFGGAYTWRHLLLAAYNVSSAVAAVHGKGHRIGDLRDANILVAPNSLITLIDCDSFQVVGKDGTVFPTRVGTGEYLPPELQSSNFKSTQVDRYHSDLFALAVLVFKLLMLGAHPFQSRGAAVEDLPSTEAKIARGIYPYARAARAHPPAFAPDIKILPPAIRRSFERAFVHGHGRPELRPRAEEWFEVLGAAGPQLKTCRRNINHVYAGHARKCPWCEMSVNGSDPFPPPVLGSQSVTREARPQPASLAEPKRRVPAQVTAAAQPPRDLSLLRQLLSERMKQEADNSRGLLVGSQLAICSLIAVVGLLAPVIAVAGMVLVVVPILATTGLAMDRSLGRTNLRIALRLGPVSLQSVAQSLYHVIPPALLAAPLMGGIFLAATRWGGQQPTAVIQAIGCVAATGWFLAVVHCLDRSDPLLVAPVHRALARIESAALPTRLGRLRLIFVFPLLAAGLSALIVRGVVTMWPL